MERLTSKYWRNLDPWEMCGQDNYCKRGCHEQGGCTKGCIVPRIYARLAAYEDSGLEPKDIISAVDMAKIACALHELNAYKDLGPIDHIRDLIKAEQDGRLVVLDEPMRPLVWGDKEHDTILCPRCLCDLMGGFEYAPSCETVMFQCPHCGQPINSGKAIDMEQSEAEAALAQEGGTHEDSGGL